MKAWDDFLDSQEQGLTKPVVDQWLRTLKVVNFDAQNLYLQAQDKFQLSWFEEHVRQFVKKKFINNNGRPIHVHLEIEHQEGISPKKEQEASKWKPSLNLAGDLIEKNYEFSSYYSGKINEIPFQLFKNALSNPSSFNPIYIQGQAGVGKTHLLQAAAQFFKTQNRACLFVHGDTFSQHLVAAIRNGAMEKFRNMYRHQDVLIIDDIQTFGGRTASQEELFHTFNTLYTEKKQIILSGNTPLSTINDIEPRLTSRFEWGLTLNFQSLPWEDMDIFLKQKLQEFDFPLRAHVTEFLLTNFKANIKALIQAIDSLILYAHLEGKKSLDLSLEEVEISLRGLLSEEKKNQITLDKIIRAVAFYYGITPSDILGKSQRQECVFPRHIAMYICRIKLKIPFLKIGKFFGRDHSTVMTSIKIVEAKIKEQDQACIEALEKIIRKLHQ